MDIIQIDKLRIQLIEASELLSFAAIQSNALMDWDKPPERHQDTKEDIRDSINEALTLINNLKGV